MNQKIIYTLFIYFTIHVSLYSRKKPNSFMEFDK